MTHHFMKSLRRLIRQFIEVWGLIQYEDAVLPVKEFPFWIQDDLTTDLYPQWVFLYWKKDNCMWNQGPAIGCMVIHASELGHPYFRQYIIAWSMFGHYQNQSVSIDNWHSRDKHQWNHTRISKFLVNNAFENFIYKISLVSNFLCI